MTHDVFISHSSKDKAVADAVCATLEGEERIRCWIAPRDVLAGQRWDEAIIDAIAESRVMVLVLSESSNVSDDVMNEVQFAASEGVVIVPLRIADVPLSKSLRYHLGRRHWLDALDPPLERHLKELAGTVAAILGQSTGTSDGQPSESIVQGGPEAAGRRGSDPAPAPRPREEPIDASREEPEFRYDLFLSFVAADRAWVMECLYEPLRRCRSAEGRPLRICLDWKNSDIDLGRKTMKGLSEALADSQRIVVAVSEAYLDDSMGRWRLMRMAELESAGERVVPILLDPIPEGDVALGPVWLDIRCVPEWELRAVDPHTAGFFDALCELLGLRRDRLEVP